MLYSVCRSFLDVDDAVGSKGDQELHVLVAGPLMPSTLS